VCEAACSLESSRVATSSTLDASMTNDRRCVVHLRVRGHLDHEIGCRGCCPRIGVSSSVSKDGRVNAVWPSGRLGLVQASTRPVHARRARRRLLQMYISAHRVKERSILGRDRGRRRPPTGRPPAIGPRAPPSSRSGARERMGRGSRRARLVRRRWRPHRPQARRPLTAGNFPSAPPAFACSLPTRDSSRRKRKIPAYAGGFRPATVLSFPWPFVGVIRSPLCLDRCRTLPVSTRSLSWT
jgi:hypothetical protein